MKVGKFCKHVDFLTEVIIKTEGHEEPVFKGDIFLLPPWLRNWKLDTDPIDYEAASISHYVNEHGVIRYVMEIWVLPPKNFDMNKLFEYKIIDRGFRQIWKEHDYEIKTINDKCFKEWREYCKNYNIDYKMYGELL